MLFQLYIKQSDFSSCLKEPLILYLRQKVLADETIPTHLDLLVINAASGTCINRYIHGREEKKQEAVLSVSRLLAI